MTSLSAQYQSYAAAARLCAQLAETTATAAYSQGDYGECRRQTAVAKAALARADQHEQDAARFAAQEAA